MFMHLASFSGRWLRRKSRTFPTARTPSPSGLFSAKFANDARPTMPPNTSTDYADLAMKCWSGHPSDRPMFSAILESLRQILSRSTGVPVGMGTPLRSNSVTGTQSPVDTIGAEVQVTSTRATGRRLSIQSVGRDAADVTVLEAD
eukprot:Opistho-2@35235